MSRFFGIEIQLKDLLVSRVTGLTGITPVKMTLNSESDGTGWDLNTDWAQLNFDCADATSEVTKARISTQYANVSGGKTDLVFATNDSLDAGLLERMRLNRTGLKLASLTASQYVKTDANKYLTTVTGIPWSDLTSVPSTFAPSAHNHAASDVNSGTFADARIAASNVTQHQAALSIDWGQLTSVPSTFTPSAHTHGAADITAGTFGTGNYTMTGDLAAYGLKLTDSVSGYQAIHRINPGAGASSAWTWPENAAGYLKADIDGNISIDATVDWSELSSVPSTFAPSSHNHAASDVNSGTFADARIAASNVTQHQGSLALAWSQITSGKPTTLSGYGITDGVGTSRTLTAGNGISGGGDLSADRSFALAHGELTTDNSPGGSDEYATVYKDSHVSGQDHRKCLIQNLPVAWGSITGKPSTFTPSSHNHAWSDITSGLPTSLSGYGITDGVATSRTITAGSGLTGGGDLSANRTLSVDINGLTADGTPDGAADYVMTYDASAGALKKVLLNNLPSAGGGGSGLSVSTIDGGDFRGHGGAGTVGDPYYYEVSGGNTLYKIDIDDASGGEYYELRLTTSPTDGHWWSVYIVGVNAGALNVKPGTQSSEHWQYNESWATWLVMGGDYQLIQEFSTPL